MTYTDEYLQLSRPFQLNYQVIDRAILGNKPGTYALGYIQSNTFIVKYVGRSDSNLNSRLKCWADEGKHAYFKAKYWGTTHEAYEHECFLYHLFGSGLGNLIHPDRPNGLNLNCKHC